MRYTARKPKGPVLQNTIGTAVAAPTDKRGFVTPKFLGLVRLHRLIMVSGGMGRTATPPARLYPCFEHPAHPLRFKTQTAGSLSRIGVKTMIAITRASRSAEPLQPHAGTAQPQQGTIPTAHLQPILAAFNACNLASGYLERGNIAAARRKLVQALASMNQVHTSAQGGAV